jgi:hypothetical protein
VEAILKMNPEIQRQVITLLYLWWSGRRCGVREGEQPRDSGRLARLIVSYAAECGRHSSSPRKWMFSRNPGNFGHQLGECR